MAVLDFLFRECRKLSVINLYSDAYILPIGNGHMFIIFYNITYQLCG